MILYSWKRRDIKMDQWNQNIVVALHPSQEKEKVGSARYIIFWTAIVPYAWKDVHKTVIKVTETLYQEKINSIWCTVLCRE